MPRVVHFEIPTQELARSVDFYRQIFGWQIDAWPGNEEYMLVTTGPEGEPGINGAILKREGPTVNTIEVASVDATAADVVARGGRIVVEKQTIPGVGHLVYCTDPDGNIFGLMEPMAGMG